MTRIEWSHGEGRRASVTVDLERHVRHLGTNDMTGEAVTEDMGLRIVTTGEVDGMGVVADSRRGATLDRVSHPKAVAALGRLGIPTEDLLAQIEAAVAACEADHEYVEQEARRAAGRAEADRYERETEEIYRAMGR